MSKGVQIRSILGMFAIGVATLVGLLSHAGVAVALSGDAKYHTILDFTQGNSINALITNVQTTTKARTYPYSGADANPWAAINPALYPSGYTPPTPDLYVEVKMNNSDVSAGNGLKTATDNTCNQGDPTQCPGAVQVPQTFVHKLGYYSAGTVYPLNNAKIQPGGQEILNNMFTLNGQAFNMDRIRFAANRLWAQWRSDVINDTGWAQMFDYQPTGTMSFENFVNNIVHHHPMYGIVRVVVPVNTQTGGGKRVGDMYLYSGQSVGGDEFKAGATTLSDWQNNAVGTKSTSPTMVDYEAMWPGTSIPNNVTKTSDREPYSGTVTVYGMLLIDYVDMRTYNPNRFFDKYQDYIDNYSSVTVHDSYASNPGGQNIVNYILPRSSGRNVVLMDWDTLDINPVNDLISQVKYTDPVTANTGDGRMDTMDIARRKYVMGKSTAYQASEIPDAYVWEYWMRKAMTYPAGAAPRDAILQDFFPADYGLGGTGQYNMATQKFVASASRVTSFDNTEWSNMTEPDKFHAYFPNGYERGWFTAFYKLRLDQLDKTTATQAVGSWWSQLTQDAAGTLTGTMTTKNYVPFQVPAPDEDVTTDPTGGTNPVAMPNFFSTNWEDLPALAFAGGLLDVHGFMNVSGMLYTPDSCEIESHSGSELPGGATPDGGPFQYVNGALLVGNGLWLEDQDNYDDSMIGIVYNYHSFDRLRTGASNVTITKVQNIAEIKGQ